MANRQTAQETLPQSEVDLSRCDNENQNGRRCVLANTEHKTNEDGSLVHQYRASGERHEYKPVSVADLLALPMEDVPDDDMDVQVKEAVRDEAQKIIDGDVQAAYDAWVEAGKPESFNNSPRKRRMVAPENVDTVRHMLKRAGSFLDKRVRIAPTRTHVSGNSMIYFVVTDRLARKSADNGKTADSGVEEG